MPSWSELAAELGSVPERERPQFFAKRSIGIARRIEERAGRNVLYYASAFLQKPLVPPLSTSINAEDLNGFMAGIYGHDFTKDLLLILHTPGGQAAGAQTIVEYLRAKFDSIDVVIPTYAMSAGTMIALGCDRIVMGKQSQLGPTDPQLSLGRGSFSAHSIVSQFEVAKQDILSHPILAHAWAPVLQSFGPALLEEAKNAITYGQSIVRDWLERYMFADHPEPSELADDVADFFGSDSHANHARRIDREEARRQHLNVVDLEDDQQLQEDVLSLYHLSTIAFDQSPALKFVISSNGKMWVKNLNPPAVAPLSPVAQSSRQGPPSFGG